MFKISHTFRSVDYRDEKGSMSRITACYNAVEGVLNAKVTIFLIVFHKCIPRIAYRLQGRQYL